MANEDNKRNRINIFVTRIHFLSPRFGARSCLVSPSVTSTAPATSAAGAPRLDVHPHLVRMPNISTISRKKSSVTHASQRVM